MGVVILSGVAGPEVFALVFAVAELSPEVVVLAAQPVLVVVSQLVLAVVSRPVLVVLSRPVLAAEPVFDVAEPQVSVDIAVAFVLSWLACLCCCGEDLYSSLDTQVFCPFPILFLFQYSRFLLRSWWDWFIVTRCPYQL